MENEFVSYTQALALKELGFDEPCFGRYYYKESYPMLNPQSEETELVFEFGQYIRQTEVTLLAPTFSQAFRWFREKYRLYPIIDSFVGVKGVVKFFYKLPMYDETFNTYEEAESACLDKLIEIVKHEDTTR